MYTITLPDPRLDEGDELIERVAYTNVLRSELLPDVPPITVEDAVAASAYQPARQRTYAFRLRDPHGDLAGNATTTVDPDDGEDPDVLVAGVNVLPAHRRQGLATRLLAELVTLARALGKTHLVGETYEALDTGAAFATAIGATALQDRPVAGINQTTWELPVETAEAWLDARRRQPSG